MRFDSVKRFVDWVSRQIFVPAFVKNSLARFDSAVIWSGAWAFAAMKIHTNAIVDIDVARIRFIKINPKSYSPLHRVD
jgi:hypothetical protein